MNQNNSRFFSFSTSALLAGAVIGIVAPLLQKLGNPDNMGLCAACFGRDIVGALGLHRAAAVQYLRPELLGLVLGSLFAALAFREFKARTGAAPLIRFLLGAIAMIAALVFLGCPWRALLRLAGGDLNTLTGIFGLIVGVVIGVQFLKAGFTLGMARPASRVVGWTLPVLALGLLVLRVFEPRFGADSPIFASAFGPGSMAAPLMISLGAGLVVGFFLQRSRLCTTGAIRNVILMRETHLLQGVFALVVLATATNLALGQISFGWAAQPIAHSNHVWNLLPMVLAGLAFTLAGGCPGRQLVLAGEGDGDAAVFVLGMLTGAAFAHNFDLAARPDTLVDGTLVVGGVSAAGMVAVGLGFAVCLVLGFTMREPVKG